MAEVEPSRFQTMLFAAREASISRAPEPDTRSDVQVYLDVAYLIRWGELIIPLQDIRITLQHMEQLLDAEAYALGTDAHRKDGGFYTEELEGLLQRFGEVQQHNPNLS